MVKINVHFTLSSEIYEKLTKIDNRSSLVEQLLSQHFQFLTKKGMDDAQIRLNIAKEHAKIARSLKKEAKILKILDDFDIYTVRWLRGFTKERPYLQEYIDYKKQREHKINYSFENIIKLWEVINKHGHLFEKI